MAEKEKEQKSLGIYQQIMNFLGDVSENAEVGTDAPFCPKCGSGHVVKNGLAHGKSRFRCNDFGAFFGSTTGKLTGGTSSSNKTWDTFLEGMLCDDSLIVLSEKCGISLPTAHS